MQKITTFVLTTNGAIIEVYQTTKRTSQYTVQGISGEICHPLGV